jgi:hypothetical protein
MQADIGPGQTTERGFQGDRIADIDVLALSSSKESRPLMRGWILPLDFRGRSIDVARKAGTAGNLGSKVRDRA